LSSPPLRFDLPEYARERIAKNLYHPLVNEPGIPTRTGCLLCGRPTYDPDRKERPWSRGVSGGRQVLVCPVCQVDRPDWADRLDRCETCGSTRLSATLGEVVCRQCGAIAGSAQAALSPPEA